MKIENTAGLIMYGLHFYPGVARYQETEDQAFEVFINEKTIRAMDPTFAGKPIFVEHVDEVDPSIDNLRKEADGWVVESFFNAADGKHWVKMVITSERGMRAVKSGLRLSNAYIPKTYGQPGMWNGISYDKEITSAEYQHLALVSNPRYEESVIMTPEEFKQYNLEQEVELKRIANSKDQKGESKMGLNFFKRAKIDNALDIESTVVELPKSKKEMTISALVNEMDKVLNMHGYASEDHMVKVGENEMSVKDLVKKHMDACNELADLKKSKEEKDNASDESLSDDEKDVDDRGGDVNMNKEEDSAKDMEKEEAKKNAIAKAEALKNARPKLVIKAKSIDLPQDKLARGRELF